MFKKRRHKIAALDRVIERHLGCEVDIETDDRVDAEFRAKALKKLNEETDALISAAVAYETEPVTIAAAVSITSIFWLGIVWPIVSVI